MNFTLPTDPHELAWLTNVAIDAHCEVNSFERFTIGYDIWCRSAVSLLLAETKSASLRRYSGELLPLLGALSALDQYGTCYAPVPSILPKGLSSKSGVIKSAHNFLSITVDSKDSDALYAIRNSLMHQSSLISVDVVKKVKNFWFEIDNNIDEIFVHAATPWDGIYSSRSESNRTLVNSRKILDLAFELTKILKEKHKLGQLSLDLKGGLEELLTNYVDLDFFVSRRDSYIMYVGYKIHEELFSQPGGVALAKQVLTSVPQAVKDEAARWLVSQPGAPKLELIAQHYPSVKLHP